MTLLGYNWSVFRLHRQAYVEGRAFAGYSFYLDYTLALVNNLLTDVEAQASSFAGRLGCEERLEN